VYVYNSSAFQLGNDSVRFVVGADGTKQIENYAVIPRGDDNFDFESSDGLAAFVNPDLENRIDPSGIGISVGLHFVNSIATKTYGIDDYNSDLATESSWSVFPQLQLPLLGSIPGNLFADGVTNFSSGGMAIVYGSPQDDNLDHMKDLEGHPYLGATAAQGGLMYFLGAGDDYVAPAWTGYTAHFEIDGGDGSDIADFSTIDETLRASGGVDVKVTDVELVQGSGFGDDIEVVAGAAEIRGGEGDDTLVGADKADRLQGGAGNDLLRGGAADDLLESESGSDTLVGGQGNDVYSVERAGQTYSATDDITIKFSPGDGHDYIYTSQGDRTSAQENAFRQLELRTGVHYERSITIDLTSFSPGDFKLVWDKHQDGTFSDGTPSYSGDAALVVKSTGESIYLGNVTTNGNSDYQQFDSQENIVLQFGNDLSVGVSWVQSGDYHSGLTDFIGVVPGLVDAYRGALQNWPNAAPPPPPPPTSAQSVTADASGLAFGTEYNDTLHGAGGPLTLAGGAGDDTYLWDHGSGTTQVIDTGDDLGDRLQLQDINIGGVTIQTLGVDALLVISPSQTGGSDGGVITLSGALNTNVPDGVDQLVFADGTTWSRADIQAHAVVPVGTAGDDTLLGSSKAETLVGGAGNDSIDGGGGGDAISWSQGDGDDRVATNVGDTLALHGVTSSQVHLIAQPGQDVRILIAPSTPGGQDGGSIDLPGGLNAYHGTTIAFDDGTTWAQSSWQGRLEIQPATGGNDTLVSFAGAHTLAGGAGDDLLQSAGGQDTIVWAHGDGQDSVAGYGTDTLVLQDATQSQVTFTHDGSDLTVHIAPSAQGGDGGSVAMVGSSELDTWGGPVTQVQFADGSILTRDQIRVQLLMADATPGADTITGFSSDDTLAGGQGDDQLSGKSGDDTYVWNPGDGHDTVSDGAYNGDDTLVLHGVTPDRITLHSTGSDLQLAIAPSTPGGVDGGSVVLVGEGQDYQAGVEHVVFDGGVTWLVSDLFQQALGQEGTAGNDTIVGFVTDDTLAGGAGDDTLSGGDGIDQYVWSHGDGHDAIVEVNHDGTSDGDVLVLHGVAPADVSVAQDGGDILLTIAPSAAGVDDGGSVRLVGELSGTGDSGVEEVHFDSGSVLYRNDLSALLIAGEATSGNDVITGFSRSETLDGGAGADTLTGGDGGDVFRFSHISDSTPSAPDLIVDFQQYSDSIDLSGIDADTTTPAMDGVFFIGTGAFDHVAGELRIDHSTAGETLVELDSDGNGVADFAIRLTGNYDLSSQDFGF
jgi:Ca2+-binding RTX toxin-like protein